MKKEYLVLIALIIGLSAYLLLRNSDKVEYQLPDTPRLTKNAITRIDIQKGGKTLSVIKENGKWVTGEKKYAADPAKVDAMLQAVDEFTLTAMVSESKSYERYNLTDDKKITVTAKDKDGKALVFDLGKTAGTHRHSFVKLPGNPAVYHASGNLEGNFDLNLETLRDKVVLSFPMEEITGITLKHKDQTLALALKTVGAPEPPKEGAPEKAEKENAVGDADLKEKKETKQWQTADGKEVNEEGVQTLLRELSNLRCKDYLPDKSPADFKTPVYVIDLAAPGATSSVSLYDPEGKEPEGKEKDTFQAVSSASPEPFVLPKWVAEKIMPEFSKLLKAEKD